MMMEKRSRDCVTAWLKSYQGVERSSSTGERRIPQHHEGGRDQQQVSSSMSSPMSSSMSSSMPWLIPTMTIAIIPPQVQWEPWLSWKSSGVSVRDGRWLHRSGAGRTKTKRSRTIALTMEITMINTKITWWPSQSSLTGAAWRRGLEPGFRAETSRSSRVKTLPCTGFHCCDYYHLVANPAMLLLENI